MSEQNVSSPIGMSAAQAREQHATQDSAYRAVWDAQAGSREIAWLLIQYRMDHDISQQELAARVGLSRAQIARIESGRHKTSLDTLYHIAHGLHLRMVVGFEDTTTDRQPVRQLVTL